MFQSAKVIVADAETGSVMHTIPVQDGAGIAAVAVNNLDGTLFVVDESVRSRLRIFDPKSFSLLKEEHFENRVLNFSNYKLLHLSRDGNWLFLYTYSYPDAAHGIRIFDVRHLTFVPLGIREVACKTPILASAIGGSVFALCPGIFQDISPSPNLPGDFEPRASVAAQLSEIVAAAATPDGHHVYAVGTSGPGADWRLADWDRISGELRTRDLATVLDVPSSAAGHYRWAWLGISSNARDLALVQDSDAWLIGRESLKVSAHYKLPSPALGADFVPDGGILLTLHSGNQGDEFILATTPIAGGDSHVVTIGTGLRSISPTSFAVGPGE